MATQHRTGDYRLTGDDPAILATDHWFELPLDHRDPGGPTIEVFARELAAAAVTDAAARPLLLFLQGGPGGKSPRPGALPSWVGWALERYRVLLLDQRGTGRSSPRTRHTLLPLGDAVTIAEHLSLFRADSIVADAEAIRVVLQGDTPWHTLGQSFGGFVTFSYLSFAPDGLADCLVTGGIPPIGRTLEDVYLATARSVGTRTAALDVAHPWVRPELARIAEHLDREVVRLPTGEVLTRERLRELGNLLGTEPGPDRLAAIVEEAWVGAELSDTFLRAVDDQVSYATGPLYALVHEACCCEVGVASRWAADRVRAAGPEPDTDGGLSLVGEVVQRSSVYSDPAMAPLADAADALAERVWDRPLYDRDQLARNVVPVAAYLYEQDMYVDAALSRQAAESIAGLRIVADRNWHHDALRVHGPDVLDALTAGDRA